MRKKIRILIVTYLPWREDNNIGNSYSNIFKDTTDRYEFAQIYVRDGFPQNTLAKDYYHISEKKMIEHLWNKKVKVGRYFHVENSMDSPKDVFSSFYNKMRILRWQIFFLVQDLIGVSKCWKRNEFDQFIDNFKPDIIFGTLPTRPLISNIMLYIKDKWNIPLITYPWDDYYSLDHDTFSPIFWIRKFLVRYYLRRTAAKSEFLYVITSLMKDEYEKIFNKKCKLLFKGYQFDVPRYMKDRIHTPINLVYMGNIGGGRWKTLRCLAQVVKEINKQYKYQVFQLNIYTLSPNNKEIFNGLNIKGVSRLNAAVSNRDVFNVMNSADILLHVEPFKKSEYQFYRASFSTKLVDYFYAARCILAIGGMTASIDYLRKNDAAICILDKDSIRNRLQCLIENPNVIMEYAQKSWNCGVRNHQIVVIQGDMYNDIKNVMAHYDD